MCRHSYFLDTNCSLDNDVWHPHIWHPAVRPKQHWAKKKLQQCWDWLLRLPQTVCCKNTCKIPIRACPNILFFDVNSKTNTSVLKERLLKDPFSYLQNQDLEEFGGLGSLKSKIYNDLYPERTCHEPRVNKPKTSGICWMAMCWVCSSRISWAPLRYTTTAIGHTMSAIVCLYFFIYLNM